jgi:hypothetical protein
MTAEMKLIKAAHTRVSAAKSALAAATAAAEKARRHLADVGLEVIAHVKRHEDAAASRVAALREAMKLGGRPLPAAVAPAKDRLQRLAAEDRQAVAKRVLHDLVAEEQDAQREVDEAIAELHAAARAVIGAEVDDAVMKVVAIERDAMLLRAEIDGLARSGVAGWGNQIAMSDAGKRVLAGNATTSIGIKNSQEWALANEFAEGWRARQAFLLENCAPVAIGGRAMESAASPAGR